MPSDWQDVQRRFYDATADEYDENFQQANPYFAFVLDRFLAAVDPRPGERILELGASGGRFTLPLLDCRCEPVASVIGRVANAWQRVDGDHAAALATEDVLVLEVAVQQDAVLSPAFK